jgi:hypothetical protein
MTNDPTSTPGTGGDRGDPVGSEPAREKAPWTVARAFGLTAPLPLPVFLVLDAAEEYEFTGAIGFGAPVSAHVYFDHGRFVLAERESDAALADRFVAAGATDATTIEQASVLVGDDRYLGRLFDRAPHIDRIAVLVALDVITQSTVADIARALVDQVDVWPYRRHPSGVHRWERTDRVRPRATVAWPAPVPPPPVRSLRAEALGALGALPAPTSLPAPVIAVVVPSPADSTGEPTAPTSHADDAPSDELRDVAERRPEAMVLPARRPGASEPPPDELGADDTDPAGAFRVVWPSGEVELAVPLAEDRAVEGTPPTPTEVTRTTPSEGSAVDLAPSMPEFERLPEFAAIRAEAVVSSVVEHAASGGLAPPDVPTTVTAGSTPGSSGTRVTGAPLFDPDEDAPASAFPPPPPPAPARGADVDDVFHDAPLPMRGSDRARRRRRSWPR